MHLAKFTDRPAASSRLSTFNIEVRYSCQVTLAIGMPSSQLATSSSVSLRAFRTIRVKADDRMARSYPALLNSYSRQSGLRKAALCLSLSAVLTWWYPDFKSNYVNNVFPFSLPKTVFIVYRLARHCQVRAVC